MAIDGSANSKSTATLTLFHILVVINIYNLVIIKINDCNPATQVLFTYGTEMIEILLLTQTIAFVFVIILNTKQNVSCIIQGIKFSVIVTIYLTMIFDIMTTAKIANDLIGRNRLNEFWEILNDEKSTVPDRLYFFVAGVLVFYVVIKSYALWAILRFAKKFLQGKSESFYLISVIDIEQNRPRIQEQNRHNFQEQSIPITPPPLYEECENLPPLFNVSRT